jgi:hypothetical protein
VLRLAAEKAGWDQPLPNGGFRGVAVAESFKTFVAQIAEVSLDESGRPKVERVVCAVDCGVAVNPDVIRAQMEGGIGFGAVMKSQLTIEGGAAQEGNFDGYDVLRLNEMPHVEIHIVPSPDGRRVSESPACRPSACRGQRGLCSYTQADASSALLADAGGLIRNSACACRCPAWCSPDRRRCAPFRVSMERS